MCASKNNSVYYSVPVAAWILGVEPARVSRAIRLGTLRSTRRNGRLVVPAVAVINLLGQSVDRGAA